VLCAAYKNDRGFIRRKGLNTGHPNWLAVFRAFAHAQGDALFTVGIAIGMSQAQLLHNCLSDRCPAVHLVNELLTQLFSDYRDIE